MVRPCSNIEADWVNWVKTGSEPSEQMCLDILDRVDTSFTTLNASRLYLLGLTTLEDRTLLAVSILNICQRKGY